MITPIVLVVVCKSGPQPQIPNLFDSIVISIRLGIRLVAVYLIELTVSKRQLDVPYYKN